MIRPIALSYPGDNPHRCRLEGAPTGFTRKVTLSDNVTLRQFVRQAATR